MTQNKIVAWNVRGFYNTERVLLCENLVRSYNLDMLCSLEAKNPQHFLYNQWFVASHSIFDSEASCDNFDLAFLSRI
ncbi:hypothetical protein KFK09_018251 [Dendrobium nobile]|uniref:Uncharacterized protein n=1 Tax=Dendrobium nobile TaxID=94219 RepID=A0A8T3AUC1_DENNO|nr:hypothetical protein KFK09_018251 [Dendrobium nobile]